MKVYVNDVVVQDTIRFLFIEGGYQTTVWDKYRIRSWFLYRGIFEIPKVTKEIAVAALKDIIQEMMSTAEDSYEWTYIRDIADVIRLIKEDK